MRRVKEMLRLSGDTSWSGAGTAERHRRLDPRPGGGLQDCPPAGRDNTDADGKEKVYGERLSAKEAGLKTLLDQVSPLQTERSICRRSMRTGGARKGKAGEAAEILGLLEKRGGKRCFAVLQMMAGERTSKPAMSSS